MQKQLQSPIVKITTLDEMMQQGAMKMDRDPQAYEPSSKMQKDFQEFVEQFILKQDHDQENELVSKITEQNSSDFD